MTAEMLWEILAGMPIKVVKFEGDGEPLCNPHLKDLLRLCSMRGIRSAMTTNGTLLNNEWVRFLESTGMRRIHISFDGVRRDTFERMRIGADYEKVLYNCRLIGNSKIQLFMSCVLVSEEIVDQLFEYIDLAKEVGATGIHLMKLQQEDLNFGDPPNLSEHQDLLRDFRRRVRKAGLIFTGTITDVPTFHECQDVYTCPYVLLNGDVYSCSYMANLRRSEGYAGEVFHVPHRSYCMGNLGYNDMRSIWKGNSYKCLREVLRKTRKPNGWTISVDALLDMKRLSSDLHRFSYCLGCLCRWGESGL
jgi:MoaA/NifB/PqqE/SkfB family radical SAM enzyme